MKQFENYKNITESTETHPPLDRMETQDTTPTNHNQFTNQTWLTKHLPYNGTKTNKIIWWNIRSTKANVDELTYH